MFTLMPQFYNNVHSYSQLILLPWGYSTEPTPDHEAMMDLAVRVGLSSLPGCQGRVIVFTWLSG